MTRPELPGDLSARLARAHRPLQAVDEALVADVQRTLADRPHAVRQAVLGSLRWELTVQRGLALVPVAEAAGYWRCHSVRYVAQFLGISRGALYRRMLK